MSFRCGPTKICNTFQSVRRDCQTLQVLAVIESETESGRERERDLDPDGSEKRINNEPVDFVTTCEKYFLAN